MESEIKSLKDEINDMLQIKQKYEDNAKYILQKYNKLADKHDKIIEKLNSKDLNKIRDIDFIERGQNE